MGIKKTVLIACLFVGSLYPNKGPIRSMCGTIGIATSAIGLVSNCFFLAYCMNAESRLYAHKPYLSQDIVIFDQNVKRKKLLQLLLLHFIATSVSYANAVYLEKRYKTGDKTIDLAPKIPLNKTFKKLFCSIFAIGLSGPLSTLNGLFVLWDSCMDIKSKLV